MLAARYLPHYTIDDYQKWEGDWELIHGIAYAMTPSAGFVHQRISSKINLQLGEQLEKCSHCIALFEIDWIVAEDTVVRPDNVVICYEPEGEYLTRAPEIVFEIVSKSTARKDEQLKFSIYETEGVKYYILVYPSQKRAKIFERQEGKYVKIMDAIHENVEFDLSKCRINFDFARLWK